MLFQHSRPWAPEGLHLGSISSGWVLEGALRGAHLGFLGAPGVVKQFQNVLQDPFIQVKDFKMILLPMATTDTFFRNVAVALWEAVFL